jgi:Zn ribbon nucleic-acid-binding protein
LESTVAIPGIKFTGIYHKEGKMKKGFSVFLIKTVVLWVIILGLLIMMFVNPKNEKINTTQAGSNIEEQGGDSENRKTNPLQMVGIFLGIGAIITVKYIFGSRCPKCGQWFAMGKTIAERVQIGLKSKTKGKSRNKFGLGAILALFDPRFWWLGLRSGGTNYSSTTDSKVIYGLKKTRFCLECGYEHTKMPK